MEPKHFNLDKGLLAFSEYFLLIKSKLDKGLVIRLNYLRIN